jgi:endonuclease G
MLLKAISFSFLLLLAENAGNADAFSTNNSRGSKDFSENFTPARKKREQIVRHTGYSLCYSPAYEQAKWVAYRLTAMMCSGEGEERSNNFREDPDVRGGSAQLADYLHSGYDRGHLCPAGDMSWSRDAMSESFYLSNMSPQEPGFNRGIWKRLEDQVRKWAKSNDELFVVTAGVLRPGLKTIGTNKVAVPELYYKVILDNTLPSRKAVAFVMPNKSSKDELHCFAVSIDSVESLTGIDFFPALPDGEEEMLEAMSDMEIWR